MQSATVEQNDSVKQLEAAEAGMRARAQEEIEKAQQLKAEAAKIEQQGLSYEVAADQIRETISKLFPPPKAAKPKHHGVAKPRQGRAYFKSPVKRINVIVGRLQRAIRQNQALIDTYKAELESKEFASLPTGEYGKRSKFLKRKIRQFEARIAKAQTDIEGYERMTKVHAFPTQQEQVAA